MSTRKLSNGHGSVTVNDAVIKNLRDAICVGYVTQVGILGSKAAGRHESVEISSGKNKGMHKEGKGSSALTNAEIGLMHEKGVMNDKGRLPRRSFLEMPLLRNAKVIFEKKKVFENALNKAIAAGTDCRKAWKKAYTDLGIEAEKIVLEAFEQSGPGWAPNAPATVIRKQSDSPLIDTGQLRRSISSRVITR